MSRVLIAAPISGHKQYSINEWFKWISLQEYENFEFALCVNGENQERLVDKLNEVEIIDKFGKTKRPVILINTNKQGVQTTRHHNIVHARESLRKYAEINNYDYILFLDTDTIPIQGNALQMLIDTKKEAVSGLYFYKKTKVPVLISPVSKTNFTLKEIEEAAEKEELLDTAIFGLGCALLHKNIFTKIPFDYSVFGKEVGDDYGYCWAMDVRKIKRYTEPRVVCQHLGPAMENPSVKLTQED